MRSRILAVVAGLAVAAVTLVVPCPPPARAASPLAAPVLGAAGWTVGQLTDGTHASGGFGPDHGMTADLVLGLAATGAADATSRAVAGWLADHAQAYIDGGYAGDVSAGAVAKLALIARTVGSDVSSFGGLDLDRILRGRLTPSGRFTDALTDAGPQPLDLSNVFTQSLGILALRDGTDAPATAVDYLVRQRCTDGGFPVFYPQRPGDCVSDADGTGMAVQALLAVGRGVEAAPALAWLLAQQAADGSFRNGGPGAVANSNSTALAAQALRAAGRTTEADAAVSWLVSRQVACDGPVNDRGAVGYAEPVADASALRATAQALPALAGVSLADSDDVVGHGADEVPVALCTATPSPTTTTTTATSPATTTTTATTAAATPVPTQSSTSPAPPAAMGGNRSRTPGSRSTPAPTPPPIPPAATPDAEAPAPAAEAAAPDESGDDPPTEPDADPSAVAAVSAGGTGGSDLPGIPWWVGLAAVVLAAAGWLAATGRLRLRSAAG